LADQPLTHLTFIIVWKSCQIFSLEKFSFFNTNKNAFLVRANVLIVFSLPKSFFAQKSF